MAQGNQVACSFGGLNSSDSRNAQDIAFFGSAQPNERQGLGLHLNKALRDGDTVRGVFATHVHHVGLALVIKMGQ
jgi:hypothetical protein